MKMNTLKTLVTLVVAVSVILGIAFMCLLGWSIIRLVTFFTM